MAIALVQHSAAGSSNGGDSVATGLANYNGVTLLVGAAAENGDPAADRGAMADGANLYVPLTDVAASQRRCNVQYVNSATPTVSISQQLTDTLVTGGIFPSAALVGFSGSAASPLDQQNSATTSGATELQTGSITPSEDGCVVVAVLCVFDVTPFTIDSGFTLLEEISRQVGQHFGFGFAYKIQTTAAAVNPKWTWTGGSLPAAAKIVSFKSDGLPPPSGSTGGMIQHLRNLGVY